LTILPNFPTASEQAINLVLDATFFGRTDGVLVFRAKQQNLYWQFINTENVYEISKGLIFLDRKGHRFASITIDGKKGVRQLLEQRYPNVPVQFCQFHQAQIIRRYLTLNPKTECGKMLNAIMKCLTDCDQAVFGSMLESWAEIYHDFLAEKNDSGQYKHRRLRSAHRSLRVNLPCLFAYKQYPELNIPNTTNSCDGSFAHWKQKIKIHRGLKKHRRSKMINFLLSDKIKS